MFRKSYVSFFLSFPSSFFFPLLFVMDGVQVKILTSPFVETWISQLDRRMREETVEIVLDVVILGQLVPIVHTEMLGRNMSYRVLAQASVEDIGSQRLMALNCLAGVLFTYLFSFGVGDPGVPLPNKRVIRLLKARLATVSVTLTEDAAISRARTKFVSDTNDYLADNFDGDTVPLPDYVMAMQKALFKSYDAGENLDAMQDSMAPLVPTNATGDPGRAILGLKPVVTAGHTFAEKIDLFLQHIAQTLAGYRGTLTPDLHGQPLTERDSVRLMTGGPGITGYTIRL